MMFDKTFGHTVYHGHLSVCRVTFHVHSAFTDHVNSIPLHSTEISRILNVKFTVEIWCIFYTYQRICCDEKIYSSVKFSLTIQNTSFV